MILTRQIANPARHAEWDNSTFLSFFFMKLPANLLQAITVGVAVSTLSSSCQQNEVNSGLTKKEKKEKARQEKKNPSAYKNCPACGMG